MKIVIERDMLVSKVKRALEILIAEDDLVADYLNDAEIKNNVVIKIEKDEGSDWLNERMAQKEYIISNEYIKEMENTILIENAEELKEIIFPYEWSKLEWEIEGNILRCKDGIKKVEKQIKDAEKYGRLPKTVKKYERNKVEFEHDLKVLNKWQEIYQGLSKQYKRGKITYGYIHDNFAMFFVYNKRKYVFAQDCPDGIHKVYELFEIGGECLDLRGEYYYY